MNTKFFFLFFLLIVSCQQKDEQHLLLEKSLVAYLAKKEHNIGNDEKYYIIPLDICRSCVESHLKFIADYSDGATILLFGGTSFHNYIESKTNYYDNNFKLFLYDSTSLIQNFQIGQNKPSFYVIKNGQVESAFIVTDEILNGWVSGHLPFGKRH